MWGKRVDGGGGACEQRGHVQLGTFNSGPPNLPPKQLTMHCSLFTGEVPGPREEGGKKVVRIRHTASFRRAITLEPSLAQLPW